MPSRLPWSSLALVLLLSTVARAEEPAKPEAPPREPLLWEAKGPATIYLLGTIHVPDERVLDLPVVVEQAMSVSGAVYTELSMDFRTQVAALAAMQVAADAPGLEKRLSEAVYARLKTYLESRSMGALLQTLERMKTWAAAMTLSTLDLLPEMQKRKALDAWIYETEDAAGKDVAGIETVEEQIGCFDALSEEEQVAYLVQILDQAEKDESEKKEGDLTSMQVLIDTWLAGDESKIIALTDESFPKDHPLRKRLIEDRNVHMADRIAAFAAEEPSQTYLLAVGTAHMLGEDGVVELLKKKGYTVRRMKATDRIEGAAPAATETR